MSYNTSKCLIAICHLEPEYLSELSTVHIFSAHLNNNPDWNSSIVYYLLS